MALFHAQLETRCPMNAVTQVPEPKNEPVFSYASGTAERRDIVAALATLAQEQRDLPLVIGGKEVRTKEKGEVRAPHRHRQVLATFSQGGATEIMQAIDAATAARANWAATPFEER